MTDPFSRDPDADTSSREADALGRTPRSYDVPVEGWSAPGAVATGEPIVAADSAHHVDDVEPAAPSRRRRSAKGATREVVETLLLAALIFLGVRLLVLNFKVDGSSMRPNLLDGELLLVNRNAYREIDVNDLLDKLPLVERDDPWIFTPFSDPERGDIVVFDPPNGSTEPYIKRILAVEGETVEIRDGGVYVNGTRVVEPYIDEGITECIKFACDPLLVPEGHVFVLGDNRRNSSDGRSFGTVPIENIIGRAWVVYWPQDGIGLVPHYDYPEIEDR
jgi:signal peptidase I